MDEKYYKLSDFTDPLIDNNSYFLDFIGVNKVVLLYFQLHLAEERS